MGERRGVGGVDGSGGRVGGQTVIGGLFFEIVN